MAMTHGMKFCGLGILSLALMATAAACGSSTGGNGGGGATGSTTGSTSHSTSTTATTGSNTTASTTTTGSNTTSSTTTTSTSTSGGTPGCAASDKPAAASIGTFDGDGGVAAGFGFYTYGGTAAPTHSEATGAFVISENAAPTTAAQYVGAGIYFNGNAAGTDCVDASTYTGIQFNLSGTISGCTVTVAINDSEHAVASATDPKAAGAAGSYPASLGLTLTSTPVLTKVPFAGTGAPPTSSAMPATAIDAKKLTGLGFGIAIPAGGDAGNCTATITIDDVAFY